jgi:ribonuclease HII
MPYEPPTHTVERSLRATLGVRTVAGVDEVGRGAWAGPVTVCAAVTGLRRPPDGLTDSKLLTVRRRTALAKVLTGWVTAYALGHASPTEIDELGMTAALRLAAVRALDALPVRPDAVILDGKHNYLGAPWQVRTVIKGDQSCVPVAAASVIAKVHRDTLMAELGSSHEPFCFAENVGYPSPVHRAALEEYGPTPLHRLSWAYLDTLPRWQHLKVTRLPAAEQLGLDFGDDALDEDPAALQGDGPPDAPPLPPCPGPESTAAPAAEPTPHADLSQRTHSSGAPAAVAPPDADGLVPVPVPPEL